MRYIFFCFYNSQYLDGKNKVNTQPWVDAVSMMFAGSISWLAILFEIYYFYILNQNFLTGDSYGGLIVISVLVYLHYYFFIKDKKYDTIYE